MSAAHVLGLDDGHRAPRDEVLVELHHRDAVTFPGPALERHSECDDQATVMPAGLGHMWVSRSANLLSGSAPAALLKVLEDNLCPLPPPSARCSQQGAEEYA